MHLPFLPSGRSGLRPCVSSVLLLAALTPAFSHAQTVTSLTARQLTDGSKMVEVVYDLAGAPPEGVTVSVTFSRTGGAPYDIVPDSSTLSGDVGRGIKNGTGKRILWDAKRTLPNTYGDTFRGALTLTPVSTLEEMTVVLPGNVPLVMVRIPGGTFQMGSPETERGYNPATEGPLHQVTLNTDYYIGKYEVTRAQWQAIMGSAPACEGAPADTDSPVTCVRWTDIVGPGGFIEKLNQHLGTVKFRLPTEAEWERAARGGTQTRFSFGDALECSDGCEPCALFQQYMWWCGNAGGVGHPVGQKLPNPYGLYDVHGNAGERVQDWWGTYTSGPQVDPKGPSSGDARVIRGGNWKPSAVQSRSAWRYGVSDLTTGADLGFRLARSVDPCSYTISPATLNVAAPGISGAIVQIRTQGQCSWTATSNASWITVATGAASAGSGSLSLDVAPNSNSAPRSGTVSVAGQTLDVVQAGTGGQLEETAVYLPGGVPLVLIRIPAGTFLMGSPDTEPCHDPNESPVHQVTLTKDYFIGKYEVTREQWAALMEPRFWDTRTQAGLPADGIPWNSIAGTDGFLERLNSYLVKTGQATSSPVRLPTDAEWERAARGGTQSAYSFGEDPGCNCGGDSRPCTLADQYVWWAGNSWGTSHPVGQKLPNPYGLYDMHGNSYEWVQDVFAPFTAEPQVDPKGPDSGPHRVYRSGSWGAGLGASRSALRWSMDPTWTAPGFRIARTVDGCTFSLSPGSKETGASGATGQTFQIQTGAGCSWSVASAVPWVTITSATTGTGPSTVTYAVGINTGTARPGSIRVSGQTFTVNQQASATPKDDLAVTLPGGVPLALTRIPAGTFTMGSLASERGRYSAEGPAHQVTLTQDYYMGVYEVTQAQWQAIMGFQIPINCDGATAGANNPVTCISWNNIAGPGGFLEKLNGYVEATAQAGAIRFRLPTEAEWERAARAGTQTRFSFGDALECGDGCEPCESFEKNMFWCGNNAAAGSNPVGRKMPSGFGLYDVHGNAWEYVSDWYGAYSSMAQVDPAGPASGPGKIRRGGYYEDLASICRSAFRGTSSHPSVESPVVGNYYVGFRLAGSQAPTCTSFSVSPGSAFPGAAAGKITVTVSGSPSPCVGGAWTAVSTADWLTLSEPSGTGPGKFEIIYPANPDSSIRKGTVSVAGRTVTVTQDGIQKGPEIVVSLPGNVPLTMIPIPGGTFLMGSPEPESGRSETEGPQHQVTISSEYYMGKFEVTNGQWRAIMGGLPWPSCGEQGDTYPVSCYNWEEVTGQGGFIEKLNAHMAATGQAGGLRFRLPTEAEWERAARAGSQSAFSFSSIPGATECQYGDGDPYMWWCQNSENQAHPAGQKFPNAFGLHDVHGNVQELVQDWWGPYSASQQVDPTGPTTGEQHIHRGGAFDSHGYNCRSAARFPASFGDRFPANGLRLSASKLKTGPRVATGPSREK